MAAEDYSAHASHVLIARCLIAYYDQRPVNKSISFELRPGELGLLTGGNGSGKTSVLRAILGEVSYAGFVSVSGVSPPLGRPWQLTCKRVRVIPQSPLLPHFLTIRQYLRAWTTTRSDRAANGGKCNGFDSEVERLICQTIKIRPRSRIGELSFGQQRLLDALLAFEARPPLVLADEPLAGVSPSNAILLGNALQRFVDGGGAVLMVVHRPERHYWSPQWIEGVVAVE